MKVKLSIALGLQLILIITQVSSISADDVKQCKEAVHTLLGNQLQGITGCIDKLGLTDVKERARKMSCILKCVLSQGIIGEDGLPDPANTLVLIEKNIPESRREKATMIIMQCQDAAANVKPDEEDCKSYDAVIKCAMNAINQFCL